MTRLVVGILALDCSGYGNAARFLGGVTLDRGVASVGGIYLVPFLGATIDINADSPSSGIDRNIEGNIVESGDAGNDGNKVDRPDQVGEGGHGKNLEKKVDAIVTQ